MRREDKRMVEEEETEDKKEEGREVGSLHVKIIIA